MSVTWADLWSQPGKSHWIGSPLLRQVSRFAGVGVVSTGVHLGLFAAFQTVAAWPHFANLTALVIATVVNTALNRRWTFGVTGTARLGWHHFQALAIFFVTWGASALGLAAVLRAVEDPSTALQVLGVMTGSAVATVIRFVAMRHWIFGDRTPARA